MDPTLAVSLLPVTMIESSFRTLLVSAIGKAVLLKARSSFAADDVRVRCR